MIWIGGQEVCSGSYLLRIEVNANMSLSFGRYGGGMPLQVRSGTYAYVGSAMGRNGSPSLTQRLLRHTTRSPGKPFHPIRERMLECFRQVGLTSPCPSVLPAGKRLHWHIDYLLDEMAVDLTGVLVVRSAVRLEGVLADLLLADPDIQPLAPGIGASDAPGKAHLLQTPSDALWWNQMTGRVALLAKHSPADTSSSLPLPIQREGG